MLVSDRGEALVIVRPQRSTRSTRDVLLVTVNVGVVSKVLFEAQTGVEALSDARLEDSHWTTRIRQPAVTDGEWWRVALREESELTMHAMVEAVAHEAIPSALAVASDHALRDLWLTGRSPGLTDVQRLSGLIRLLSRIGPRGELDAAVAELLRISKGRPQWQSVRSMLMELGYADLV
jgi:hypothetical protein